MINKVARISVYNRTDEEYKMIQNEINSDIKENNIKAYRSDYGFTEAYWGNWCMVGLPYDKAIEYANKYDLKVDLNKTIIQKFDIDGLKVGDKIQYTVDSMFGDILNKGTVYSIEGNALIVRLYKSKTKGHVLRVGSIGMIRKGWDIYNDTYKELEVINS